MRIKLYRHKIILTYPLVHAVFRIHEILVRIRMGSIPLTNGSGSFYFHHWPSRCQQKNYLKKKVFQYITLYIIFKDKKSKRCHKTVEIKVFLTIFPYWLKDPDPEPYLWLMDPGPGGPKTCGFGGSGFGSGTLGTWVLFTVHQFLKYRRFSSTTRLDLISSHQIYLNCISTAAINLSLLATTLSINTVVNISENFRLNLPNDAEPTRSASGFTKNLLFVRILKFTEQKSRIRIFFKTSWIRNTG